MLLFLAASSDLGRAAIAKAIVEANAGWRHLPLEGVAAVTAKEGVPQDDEETLVRIALHCARELMDSGTAHVIISSPWSPPEPEVLEEEWADNYIGVHVGTEEETEATPLEFTIDHTGRTPKDIAAEIASFWEASSPAA